MTNDGITTLYRPQNPVPLVLDSPHSGRIYPEDFRYACPHRILQKAEDNHVETLFDTAPDYGASLLCALFPRTYIDVNRAEDDIDPDVLDDHDRVHWPHPINPTSRSHAGIGLIRRIVKPGIAVYDRKLSIAEIRHRVERYYTPYHTQLETLIEESHYRFGQVWHINCHSMPKGRGISHVLAYGTRSALPDFVLGDRDGTSCALEFTHMIRDFLKDKGYSVAINNPYRGVELVRRYSNPATGRHSLQLEINKGLYWDETEQEKSKNYNRLKIDIENMIQYCATYIAANLTDMAAD
ncbi:MAG: N-formylglutamate amidohydrolase [Rhodospirillales bacterium]|nr:N-formylglutamate amidohydrolase [Rhodospirillales bacterium]MCB9995288.1 N-formylglutamate amidohydrolase [Rhodospirillales bacterium]